jgi:hypothetical protein
MAHDPLDKLVDIVVPFRMPGGQGEGLQAEDSSGPQLTRREALRLGVFAGIVAGLPFERSAFASTLGSASHASSVPSITFALRRRADMVNLVVRGYNLRLDVSSRPQLLRIASSAPAFITFEFPPQHVLEDTVSDTPIIPTKAMPLGSRLSGPSRVAFRLPTTLASIPYQTEWLLDWQRLGLVLQVSPKADAGSGDQNPTYPTPLETAIEAPWGLILSPRSDSRATFVHATSPVRRNGRTELWTSRLAQRTGTGVVETPAGVPELRALANAAGGDVPGITAPLTNLNRAALVREMNAVGAAAARVEHFSMSALGATMNVVGDWNRPNGSLRHWRNRSALGRDSFVRVVQAGYLFPLGHPAVFVTESQREFRRAADGQVTAYLVQRQYIVVRRTERSYPSSSLPSAALRRVWPFVRARIDRPVSPSVNRDSFGSGLTDDEAFWPSADDRDVQWPVTLWDHEGRSSSVTMPLAFVYENVAHDPGREWALVFAYADASKAAKRSVYFAGQSVALAPSTPTRPGDTSQQVMTMRLAVLPQGGTLAQLTAAGEPSWFPAMAQCEVDLTAVAALQGSSAPIWLAWADAYITNGLTSPNNRGEAYAKTTPPPDGVPVPEDPKIPLNRSGGLVAPNFPISGLSRALGPVGGDLGSLANLVEFDPTKVFANLGLKLLGEIDLLSLLPKVTLLDLTPESTAKFPKITTELVYPNGADGKPDKKRPPDGARTKLEWRPAVQDVNTLLKFNGDKTKSFDLLADFSTPLAKASFPNTYDIRGELRTFTLTLLPGKECIALTFSRVKFQARSGKKPDLDISIDKVAFFGPLQFVNTLKDYLKTAGKGPSIDVQPNAITVEYSVQLPTIAVGVFSLQNVALAAGLALPLDGAPASVDFAVSTRERPFLLTMGLFGGGGFFAFSMSMAGLRQIEASIEFGASVQLNLGVASGSASIMAGIYFKLTRDPSDKNKDQVELTGYLRAGGCLEFLGLVSISVEFYLGFTYLESIRKAYGSARVTVKIDIGFFSKSLSFSVERQIGGGAGTSEAFAAAAAVSGTSEALATASAVSGSPTFKDNIPTQAIWDTYCDAFA